MKITNPVYKELLNLNIISKKNIIKISNRTRDKKIGVYKDKKTNVIFNEKYITDIKYYESLKHKDDDRKISIKSKRKISKVKTFKGFIKTPIIQDDIRRVNQFQDLAKDKNILDFGCGWGGFLSKLRNYKLASGIELRNECLSFINKNLKNISVRRNIDEFDNKFDIITMFHVLEHIPYQVETLKKLRSKLLKNGNLIVEVPNAQDFLLSFENFNEFKKFAFWSEHLILHTGDSLKKVLNEAGFKKIKIQYHQRYNINNHLGWFVEKRPGGHNFFNNISDEILIKNYNDFLVRNKKTDTLIAIANK